MSVVEKSCGEVLERRAVEKCFEAVSRRSVVKKGCGEVLERHVVGEVL